MDICDAVVYLHGRDIVHRDLKPQNVLLRYKKGALVGHAKLADFACSRVIKGDQSFSMSFNQNTPITAIAGTPMYLPPEVLFLNTETSKVHKSWDMWAVGMIICHIFAISSIPGQTLMLSKDEHMDSIYRWASGIGNIGVKKAAFSCLAIVFLF